MKTSIWPTYGCISTTHFEKSVHHTSNHNIFRYLIILITSFNDSQYCYLYAFFFDSHFANTTTIDSAVTPMTFKKSMEEPISAFINTICFKRQTFKGSIFKQISIIITGIIFFIYEYLVNSPESHQQLIKKR